MFFYIIRRLIAVVIMLFVISMTTFLVFYAGPDDPARLTCAKNCTPAVIAANRHAFGFDKPIATQYTDFVKGLVSERKFPDDPAQERPPRRRSPTARRPASATPSCGSSR